MAVPSPSVPGAATDLEWGVARGIAGFRWLAWGWSVAVLWVTRDDLGRAGVAVGLTGVALAVTAAATVASIRRLPWLFGWVAVTVEVAVGVALLLADGWAYRGEHGQSLGSAWPVAGVLMAGIVAGPVAGAGAGAVLGLGRWVGNELAVFEPASNLAIVSSAVLFTIAGAAAGAVMDRVREADTAMARARARDEVARTLHDGVLQTLAVVQRRSTDVELATLAREQERELRAFLAGDQVEPDELGPALRQAAAKVARRDGLRVEVLFVDDQHPAVAPAVVAALAGAVTEALTNAHKHGAATRATVFVDVDHGIFCSIKDDGCGFDPAVISAGRGTNGSIHGRLTEVGGTAEVDARPGTGVEVRLRAPLRARRDTTSP